ncbi:response regulator [Occallatibacter savannae]|uniref:response regulator n=1 Tax=Occallatibacter savannae TaxID=1002691 RepID=UPI000D688732|nr:response regulator [Occallatibacter savannae]
MCAFRSGEKPRVLVADDEKTIADTLKLILTGAGYDVRVVYNGIAAVEKAVEWSPDLLLSDVYMPGLSGIDAAIQVCEHLPHCRVLLISGQADLQELRREIQSKCRRFDVFPKPVHPTELLERMQAMLSQADGQP